MPLPVTFLFGGVLGAATAAAAPVIIHLIMRTKPREVVFPPLRFVKKSHRANLSKLKLKHLLLLLLRIAAIALIAFLIARPRLPAWRKVVDRSLPVAVAFVVDNSASMRYQYRKKPLLSHAKQLAQQVIESLPDGSRVAVLTTANPLAAAAFRPDRKLAAQQIADVPQSFSAKPIAPALGRAVNLLHETDLSRKQVCVLSDMTAQSWREGSGVAADQQVDFTVLNCAGGPGANVWLGDLHLSAGKVPPGVAVTVETLIRSARLSGQFNVQAELDGTAADPQTVRLARDGSTTITLDVRPKRAGLAHGKVTLVQRDSLQADNVRYFTLRVEPPDTVLVVRDPTTVGRGDPTSFLMANAIVAGGTGSDQAWVRRQTVVADRLTAEQLAKVPIALLANVAALPEAQWKSLLDFVTRGGHLWVVVGPLTSPAAYNAALPQQLLPVALKSVEGLARPAAWQTGRTSHPMLAPFAGTENPPLSEVRIYKRFAIQSTAEDAVVVLSYEDGPPAIALRNVGQGSVLFWNFSPARNFSNLAELGQFPVLAQQALRLLLGSAEAQVSYPWGASVILPVPKTMTAPAVTLRKGASEADVPAGAKIRGRAVTMLADEIGPWTVRFTEDDRTVFRGFSVNVAASESDLTPIKATKVTAMFPPDSVVIARTPEEVTHKQRLVTQALDLAVPVLLVLLALLTVESFFANRFYRRAEQGTPQEPT